MRYEESGDGYSNIVQWGYDDENNLSSQTQTLNGSTYASTYAYDKDNRLTKATEGAISANYTYDSFSRMTGLTSKNGSTSVVSTAVTYVDPSSSATSTQVKTWNNGKAAYTYTYDNKGNITSISDGSKTVTYAYDAFGRLVDVYDPVAKQHCVYTYDDGGNLLQQVIYKPKQSSGGGGGDIVIPVDPPVEPPIEVIVAAAPDDYGYYLSATVNYTYGDANWPDLLTAFNGKSITYDAIGNPLSDGTWTYAWQHGRQLASMSKSGSSIAYGYNADGKRISKTVNGTTYNYAYLGDTLTDLSWGSNRMHFTYDSLGPASVTYNGVKYFYLKNAQGDVTGLVNASGTQVVSYTYDPWGAPMSTDGTMASTLGAANPLRYRGYVYDSETGLYYLSSRYYNPTWGRFINADTADVLGASPGKANWDKNLFAYCDNDPVNRQDNGGDLWQEVLVDALISGVVGGVFGLINDWMLGEDLSFGTLFNNFWKSFAKGFASSLAANSYQLFSPLPSVKRTAQLVGAIYSGILAFGDVVISSESRSLEMFNRAVMAAIVAIMSSAVTALVPEVDGSAAEKVIGEAFCKMTFSAPCEAVGSTYIAATTYSSSRRSRSRCSGHSSNMGMGRRGPVRMTV